MYESNDESIQGQIQAINPTLNSLRIKGLTTQIETLKHQQIQSYDESKTKSINPKVNPTTNPTTSTDKNSRGG